MYYAVIVGIVEFLRRFLVKGIAFSFLLFPFPLYTVFPASK